MKKTAVVLTIAALCALILSACGAQTPAEAPKSLNFYGWADYLDPEVVAEFEKKYNCKVNYDVFANNEDLFAKLQAGGGQYDLIQPSDYMVPTMAKLGMLEKLNLDNIPNAKRAAQSFGYLPYDPKSEYSVIFAWGITGIAYNKKYVKTAPTSWADLWQDEYKGRVVLLNDSREVLGMALKKNGFSNSSVNPGELKTAFDDLKRLAPNVLAYDTDNIKQKFIAGEVWIGTVWSGDAVFIQKDNPDIGFVLAKEHGLAWADTMAIPKGARNRDLAEKFINFLYDPAVSARNYAYIGYADPNKKGEETNAIFRMSWAALESSEWLSDVGDALTVYDRYWTELKTVK